MEIMLLIVIILICGLSILVCGIENLRFKAVQKQTIKRALNTISN